MTFRTVPLQNKKKLIELIRTSSSLLEEGMEIIDSDIGSEEIPLIDLVARRRSGEALLIHTGVTADEKAFLHAAAQSAWFQSNHTLLRRIYPELTLDNQVPPRAALIYPEFPHLMKRFVRAAPPSFAPMLFRYRCLVSEDTQFLYLERFDKPREQMRLSEEDASLPPFRTGIAGKDVMLSPEEREAFFS
ncbi:MAG: hypothetical protein GXP58_10130 [Deltaproteobacteria bacterium]|nr:hypothetical protein [Deltaproteobacteria bacterium]